LDVLESLVSNVNGVLFVGTYRDDETTRTRVLDKMKTQLDASSVNVYRVQLENWDEDAVRFMLGGGHWKDNYELSLRMFNAAAEVSYCTAKWDDVETMVKAILLNARCFEDTLRARATQICTLGSRNRQPHAIEIGLATLKELGEELPSY